MNRMRDVTGLKQRYSKTGDPAHGCGDISRLFIPEDFICNGQRWPLV